MACFHPHGRVKAGSAAAPAASCRRQRALLVQRRSGPKMYAPLAAYSQSLASNHSKAFPDTKHHIQTLSSALRCWHQLGALSCRQPASVLHPRGIECNTVLQADWGVDDDWEPRPLRSSPSQGSQVRGLECAVLSANALRSHLSLLAKVLSSIRQPQPDCRHKRVDGRRM